MISGPARVLNEFEFNVYVIMHGCVVSVIFEIYDELKCSPNLKKTRICQYTTLLYLNGKVNLSITHDEGTKYLRYALVHR